MEISGAVSALVGMVKRRFVGQKKGALELD